MLTDRIAEYHLAQGVLCAHCLRPLADQTIVWV